MAINTSYHFLIKTALDVRDLGSTYRYVTGVFSTEFFLSFKRITA